MNSNVAVLITLFVLTSCAPRLEEFVVIEGQSIYVESDMVYLTTMEQNAVIIDSARVKDGTFRFGFGQETDPFPACIAYRDSTDKAAVVRFITDSMGRDNVSWSDCFVVQNGKTVLVGQRKAGETRQYATIAGGRENEMVLEVGYDNLAFVDVESEQSYSRSIEKVTDVVKAYSDSYLFLKRLQWHAWRYKKEDILNILSMLDMDVRRTELGKKLLTYAEALPEDYNPIEAIALENAVGELVVDYMKKRPLNMVFFTKIYIHSSTLFTYYLKARQDEFMHDDIYMADVGFEEVRSMWTSKLTKTGKTVWDQLYVPSAESRQLMFNRFKFGKGIPLIIFFDHEGNEVKRFAGYDDNTIDNCKSFIEDYLRTYRDRTP